MCLLPLPATGAVIDLNGNGLGDIWEWKFNVSGLTTNGDADGDGRSNWQESLAGTDPRSSTSMFAVTSLTISGSNAVVTWPSVLGKQYQLQTCTNLVAGNWNNQGVALTGSGSPLTAFVPATNGLAMFRVLVQDVDTAGSGFSDWEKLQIGLDPAITNSNFQLDNNGQPLSDYSYATNTLGAQSIVTIRAGNVTATQPDIGQSATDVASFSITRGGFPLSAITVNLDVNGPGVGAATEGADFTNLPRQVTFPVGTSTQVIPVTPLANTNLQAVALATMSLQPGDNYTVGSPSQASVAVYPSPTPKGTGLLGEYFDTASSTYANASNFSNLVMSRIDTNIDFTWGTSAPTNTMGVDTFSIRWTGQVQPQYSETYYFVVRSDEGAKLWVNNQLVIDKWQTQAVTGHTNSIDLQAGVRYNIKLEYFDNTTSAEAHLYWFSPSQTIQIIPTSRLYPTTNFPTAVISPMTAVAFVGQGFSYTNTGANLPAGYTAGLLPPGLSFNTTSGLLGGVPTQAGQYQVLLTASNANGVSSSVLDLIVVSNDNAVVREVWTSVTGTNVTDIPLTTAPSVTDTLSTLEGVTNYGDNYGERIRGYLTAPVTGNYYFWLAASDAAELWISNDHEPVNKVRRAYVRSGTATQQWNAASSQQSSWLALVAGQRYYIEILHKAGVGADDNWAVGWLQDPTGTNTVPSGVVPGYVLSRYFPLPVSYVPATLYMANVLPVAGVSSSGSGSGTLRVNNAGTQAKVSYAYSGLTSSVLRRRIYSEPYLGTASQLLFDIDDAQLNHPELINPDGSLTWNFASVGGLSVSDINELVKEGKSYLQLDTATNTTGEVRGNFTIASGSRTFTPPPAAPSWADDHASADAAARFLIQATFGPNSNEIAVVQSLGYEGWINSQFGISPSYHLPVVLTNLSSDPSNPYPETSSFNTWWQQSVTTPDQLRQRVAFALNQILVVSATGTLDQNGRALSDFYDTLLDHAFSNFREILEAVTLTPAMGLYLDMRRNEKGDLPSGRIPNENYAREILQLFSVGLYRLWPDGTLALDSTGNVVPSYDQNVIMGFSRVFTGWNYNQPTNPIPTSWSPAANYTTPMTLVPSRHELGTKRVLDNAVLPPAWGLQTNTANAACQAYGGQDLERAHDAIFYNDNVGPFICRQLIQRLVTSNPSRDYVYRVVQKFNDNGSGVRGDMQAVIKAILLDYEARSSTAAAQPTFGKQREPLLRITAAARAFPPYYALSGTYSQAGSNLIWITTLSPHRLNNNDTVFLSFTDASGSPAPTTQGYGVGNVSTSNFTVNATGLLTGTYTQSVNTITVNVASHLVTNDYPVYLTFMTGGAASGQYQVLSWSNSSIFTVTALDSTNRSGSCLLSRLTGGGYTVARNASNSVVTLSTTSYHSLTNGDSIFINFTSGTATTGTYQVSSIVDEDHFNVLTTTNVNNQTQNTSLSIYPLVAPPLVRSGTIGVQQSTWNMQYTDSELQQTPLNAPTVFNFFFPDYKFPGTLAAAGMTTPEFQLTSDTTVINQMNFLYNGILSAGNPNGFTSFKSGAGAVVMDLGPWMTPSRTSNAGIPGLVSEFNTLLLGGQLSVNTQNIIINYVTNSLLYTTPTTTQMRDRVRGVVHQILVTPEFSIQK